MNATSRKPSRPRSSEKPRQAKARRRWPLVVLTLLAIPVTFAAAALLAGVLALLLVNDRLPPLDAMIDYRPRIPLRVYSSDGVLIGEFGEERRTFVRIQDVPQVMKNAVLAAEDARFFEHAGVDPVGVVRAALANLTAGGIEQGSSTLTMQLAREFFLSSERTYTRKIVEILLALRIEDSLSKEQILELYLNQIFLGKRAYGFEAAAQTYFGKSLAQVTAAEAAMLAGLPKAPSRFNPLVNPRRAIERQRWILRRMHEVNFLSEPDLQAALAEPLRFATQDTGYALHAPYVAELARLLAWDLYKEQTYVSGLKVYTTIVSTDQKAANAALRAGVSEFDRRQGYRGPEDRVELSTDPQRMGEQIDAAITEAVDIEELLAAVVLEASPQGVLVSRGRGTEPIRIVQKNLRFVARALGPKAPAAIRLQRGSVVRITRNGNEEWEISQMPEVQAALVAASTTDGAVRALVGGFDFSRNKFNRVTQAWRQPGSAFKPFVYSAALEKGLMTSTLVNDAPFRLDAARAGGQVWEPKNYDGRYEGPLTTRLGLAKSKNMVSIRILDEIGPKYAQDYVARFGFEPERNPAFLTMALGAGSVTPWRMVGGISVFANGGYRVDPYIVERITDSEGRTLAQAHPGRAGEESHRVIDARNAYLMDSMLKTVVRQGTATRARTALKRNDLAGKTGTTNDSHDAWFVGYQRGLAAAAWVGYDQPRKLGDRETGGGLALPIWIDYMATALRGVPEQNMPVPRGVVQIAGEYYYSETRPGQGIVAIGLTEGGLAATGEDVDRVRDQLF